MAWCATPTSILAHCRHHHVSDEFGLAWCVAGGSGRVDTARSGLDGPEAVNAQSLSK